jgi:hypothetical protein
MVPFADRAREPRWAVDDPNAIDRRSAGQSTESRWDYSASDWSQTRKTERPESLRGWWSRLGQPGGWAMIQASRLRERAGTLLAAFARVLTDEVGWSVSSDEAGRGRKHATTQVPARAERWGHHGGWVVGRSSVSESRGLDSPTTKADGWLPFALNAGS